MEFIKKLCKRYFIDAMGAMAQGLFASLLIGTIISTIGEQAHLDVLVTIGGFAKAVSGSGLWPSRSLIQLKAPALVVYCMAAVGWGRQ